jgi:hypothetical protein
MHLPTFGRYRQDMKTLSNVQEYLGQFHLMKGVCHVASGREPIFSLHNELFLPGTYPSLERFDNCEDNNRN